MNTMTADITHIYKLASISRICFLFLSIISNRLISDHSSDSFSSPILQLKQNGICDKIIWILLGGLLRWDAQHFLHIASSGYTYENNLAFFPLFPLIIKIVGNCLNYILGLNFISSFLLTAFLLNFIFFIEAASTLYNLTINIFKNPYFAYYSVLFFCISPATIFFLAPYTESLFCLCVFKGMLQYSQGKYWKAQLWFSISVLVRSNGIVNVGFILHLFYYNILRVKFKNIKIILMYGLFAVLSICCILFPFIVYQLYTYFHFCLTKHNHSSEIFYYAKKNNLLLSGYGSVWCNSSVPLSYSYIQDHYWDVGFLRYYQWKQIPNFCLAFPIIMLILKYCGCYLLKNRILFIYPNRIYKNVETPLSHISASQFVYVVHATYLTIFALANINVQVTTRLISSSSPIIYWIATQEFVEQNVINLKQFTFLKWIFHFNNTTKTGFLIKLYFVTYAIFGTILFCNNFPWT